MTRRTVLVPGCGVDSPHGVDQARRFAAQARRRGLSVLGVDQADRLAVMEPDLVDEAVVIEASEAPAIREALGRRRIDAIVALREQFVECAATLASDYRLPGLSPSVASTIRAKDRCRQALRAAGLAQPEAVLVASGEEAADFLDREPGPWIIKPRSGMASMGVSVVHDRADLAATIHRRDPGRPFLVETYVHGSEYSAEGVVVGGEPLVLALTEKSVGDHFVETRHRLPAPISSEARDEAIELVSRALVVLGVDRGIFHVEFWVTDNGIVIGEVHGRPGGDFLPSLVEEVRPGLELWGMLLDDLLGEPAPAVPDLQRGGVVDYICLPPGRVSSISGWATAAGGPDVIASALHVHPGEIVAPIADSTSRHGVLVVVGDSLDDADRRVAFLRKKVVIVVNENENENPGPLPGADSASVAGARAPFGAYGSEIYQKGLTGKRPDLPTDPTQLEEAARAVLREEAFAYVAGGAGAGATMRANLSAFDRYGLAPRMLADNTARDWTTTILGTAAPAPLLLAPVGAQAIVDPDGELATARAASRLGVPMVLSTAASYTLEQVAEACGNGPRWYQLYQPTDDTVTRSLLDRASAAGFTVLVLTLDTWTLGWRPRDLDLGYLPFLRGLGTAIPFSDPAFRAGLDHPPEADLAAAVRHRQRLFTGTARGWDRLVELRALWQGPLVVKGIQRVDDARCALDAGADAVVVSNHGGRQVDRAIASLTVLPRVVAAVGGRAPVLFDSGIRSGADAALALSLGADAVLLGRPYVYGLALSGEAGVEHVLRCVLAELDLTLALSGHTDLASLHADVGSVEPM